MSKAQQVHEARERRHRRVRRKVSGSPERPRLNVYRSLEHIYAQVIDDVAGHTVASASTIDRELSSSCAGLSKTECARIVGKAIADRAKAAGVSAVIFDRGGYQYHGRVRALAEAAREAGLEF
ncbi:MAG: 50S ribosomal protein L18 [Anaerolineae bacterium]|jgi:large subunit ribosomal protein L18|nr:50S ribosomal protein L18 [Chloroflexota bacterium]